MNNTVRWYEIATTDIERAKDFYAEVFNSEFEKVNVAKSILYMFKTNEKDEGISGALIFDKDNIPSDKGTMIYFSCEDVSIEAGKINSAGGQLILPKTSIGNFGFIALFIDTEGNKIGLHSGK